jgi:predicted butyrate kinase (DUF1464 family)
VDPGTLSFDVCGREGERLVFDQSYTTAEIGAHPRLLVEVLRAAGPADIIVGPSGYGLPWVDAADLSARDVDLLLLGDAGERPRGTIVSGMGRVIGALRDSGLPVRFAPGVIHLATVPEQRKVNRVDMGTADKVCAVALGIWDQARRYAIGYHETAFVYVEMGGAFTAVVAVQDGAIVDGAGGTSGPPGYRAAGALDGELAYLMRGFPKSSLASGGVAWAAGRPQADPADLASPAPFDRRAATAWEAFFEGLVKGVAAMLTVVDAPREILLSGRLSRVPQIEAGVARRLSRFAPVRRVEGYAEVAAEAAQGAALLGQGLLGGPLAELVAAMRIDEAGGSALDHLHVHEADDIRRRYPPAEPAPASASDRR